MAIAAPAQLATSAALCVAKGDPSVLAQRDRQPLAIAFTAAAGLAPAI